MSMSDRDHILERLVHQPARPLFPGPCNKCGARNYELSNAGPSCCPKCAPAAPSQQTEIGPQMMLGPCRGCGAVNYPLSADGPEWCPKCRMRSDRKQQDDDQRGWNAILRMGVSGYEIWNNPKNS